MPEKFVIKTEKGKYIVNIDRSNTAMTTSYHRVKALRFTKDDLPEKILSYERQLGGTYFSKRNLKTLYITVDRGAGRKKGSVKPNTKQKRIYVRVTQAEYDYIFKAAKSAGMSMSNYVRSYLP